jgi:TatD DNase family protein
MKFIDIHSHHLKESTENIFILNSIDNLSLRKKFHYSYGIHPWQASQKIFFTECLEDPFFLAYGELGLDRVRKENWDQQINVLEKQLEFVAQNPRPLVLHCVRASSDLAFYFKKYKITSPLIFHHCSEDSSIQSFFKSDVYFSFSFKQIAKMSLAKLTSYSLDRIFFETDDEECAIEEVYDEYVKRTGIEKEKLQSQIKSNFQKVFNGY